MVKHGFEEARQNVQQGAEIFKEALDDRRKK
jgi:predicted RNase H-like HicB family nuclease